MFRDLKNANKMHQIKYSTIDYKIHYISSANSYRFRHQGAIIKEFINGNVLWVK